MIIHLSETAAESILDMKRITWISIFIVLFLVSYARGAVAERGISPEGTVVASLQSGHTPYGQEPKRAVPDLDEEDVRKSTLAFMMSAGPELLNAARAGDVDTVSLLLDQVEGQGYEMDLMVLLAAVSGEDQVAVAKLVIERMRNMNQTLADNYYSVFGGAPPGVGGYMLTYRAIHIASVFAESDLVQMILDKGADVNAKGPLGWTAAQHAATSGEMETVRLLMKYGAEEDILAQIALGMNDRLKEYLKDHDPEFGMMRAAASCDNAAGVALLLDHGMSVDGLDLRKDAEAYGFYKVNTPLFLAAINGRSKALEVLLQRGADPDGDTPMIPLAYAIDRGETEIVRLLLEYGADVNRGDPENMRLGKTYLHQCAAKGRPGAAGLLLDRGLDVNRSDKNGGTALHEAVAEKQYEMIELLLDRGADPGARDAGGNTPLHTAALAGYSQAIPLLVKKGADPEALNEEGKPPVILAAESACAECVQVIFKHAPNPLALYEGNAFVPAMESDDPVILELFLDLGADPGQVNEDGTTALHFAARRGKVHTIKALLARGADPNARDSHGRAPLHLAAEYAMQEAVEALMDGGADMLLTDNDGYTAGDIAALNGHDELADMLTP